ncbi:hypothetical protein HanIR_Chr10g0458311 [Helianthus annuus]|nr:hypothetical protein HanIR_Chr10g0458311 [Helianthus annuus]
MCICMLNKGSKLTFCGNGFVMPFHNFLMLVLFITTLSVVNL